MLLLGLVIADAVNYFSAKLGPGEPRGTAPETSIADTCSCYKREGDEMPVTR